MKFIFHILIVFTFAQAISAQSEIRSLKNFKILRASTGVEVQLINSEETKAIVKTSAKSLEYLQTEVDGDVLRIGWKNGKGNKRWAKIDLYFKDIEEIKVSSGATVQSDECISGEQMSISASSGGDVALDIYTQSANIKASSGSHVELQGISIECSGSASSGAYIKASGLITEKANISASSGAKATIFASQKLVASASSGGSVRYDGNPKTTDFNVGKYSGGSVRKL